MTENKSYSHLQVIGRKFCLENGTIRKAQELYRLCCIRSNLDKISDIPKSVLCLDLAANALGDKFDKDVALKFSTLSQANYKKYYNILEKSLELQETLSIQELCVIFNCSEAKELAEVILGKYKDLNVIHDDLSHPQYNTIAVFTACTLKDIKVSRKQFMQKCHLKQAHWRQLELKFCKFIKEIGLNANTKDNKINENNSDSSPLKECTEDYNTVTESKEEIEDYQTWKVRILKEAYEALGIKQT